MLNIFLNSIGKKFSMILALVIISICFIVFLGLNFFEKIAQISDVKGVAYKYEILCETAKFEFQKYLTTESNENILNFNRAIKDLSTKDSAMLDLNDLLEKGLGIDDAVKSYQDKVGVKPGQRSAAKLLVSLEGNPLITTLLNNMRIGHANSSRWKQLTEEYFLAKDSENKKRIAAEIYVVQGKLPEIIEIFNKDLVNIVTFLTLKIKNIFITISLITILLICLISFLTLRTITKPLKLTAKRVEEIADGNFTDSLEVKNTDELGTMVKSLNSMSDHLRGMVKDIQEDVITLNQSSSDITSFAQSVASSSSSNVEKANIVNSAAEEMRNNMVIVSQAMNTSANNTDSVVTAVEEMTATINEIAVNTENAKKIADQAVEESEGAVLQMSDLSQMANAIGQVTETIKDISEQTDLLSLNATIEAARAGDEGKGFAVVAGEIKELSKQTFHATNDIQNQIEQIQKTATDSVNAIESISKIIIDVNQIVHTIATAIEEQSIVTGEIAQNTTQVSQEITDVNKKVSENSEVAARITESIQIVHESADENFQQSSNMKEKASELSNIADTLGTRMNYFNV
jgi:methyl-accepting chemotaxis protein